MWSLIFVAVLLLVVSGSVFSQDQTDEELKKKYEAIIGEYEFDLSELGGETALLRFYVEGGALWADSGDGRPASLEPMEDSEFAFSGEDPDEGRYTKCRAVIEMLGVEIIGIKIGG